MWVRVNGVHDRGGMHGFGPVVVEPDEPVFHARWEGRVLGMFYRARHAGPGLSLLDCWLAAFERLVVDKGLCAAADLETRVGALAARSPGHDHAPRSPT